MYSEQYFIVGKYYMLLNITYYLKFYQLSGAKLLDLTELGLYHLYLFGVPHLPLFLDLYSFWDTYHLSIYILITEDHGSPFSLCHIWQQIFFPKKSFDLLDREGLKTFAGKFATIQSGNSMPMALTWLSKCVVLSYD